ncbi:MAG TPA: hypothetical protein PKA14_19800, partial [Leptospiraceae bacterium]|nr:hypothetical protein [Leptospiraceae bacterium]
GERVFQTEENRSRIDYNDGSGKGKFFLNRQPFAELTAGKRLACWVASFESKGGNLVEAVGGQKIGL